MGIAFAAIILIAFLPEMVDMIMTNIDLLEKIAAALMAAFILVGYYRWFFLWITEGSIFGREHAEAMKRAARKNSDDGWEGY